MVENFGSKTTNIIVLDLEGFKLKSLGFIIKELSLCSSYNDTIFFKPPLKFADLPAHDSHTVISLTNNLHGLDWDEGDIPYCDLKTICLSFSFRFTRKKLFAKGIEKCELLSKLLHKTVYNLEDLKFSPNLRDNIRRTSSLLLSSFKFSFNKGSILKSLRRT